jgi:hypothetical protein
MKFRGAEAIVETECKKPVKTEWKACPFCGEFLEKGM